MDNGATKRRALLIFGVSVFACALIGTLLRILSLLFFYDSDIGYFSSNAILPTLYHVFLTVAAIACAFACFVPKISLVPDNFGESKTAELLFFFPLAATSYYFSAQLHLLGRYADVGMPVPKLNMIILALAIPATAYFIVCMLGKRISVGPRVILCLLTILWMILILADNYFDMYVQVNSPNKTIASFALASAVLFLSGEMKMPLSAKKPRVRLFSTAIAVIMLSASSIPTLIAYFTGAFGNSYSAEPYDLVCLALLFPACARLYTHCFKKPIVQTECATEPIEAQSNPE